LNTSSIADDFPTSRSPGHGAPPDLAAQLLHLALELARARHLRRERLHLVHAERLHEIVERAALHRLDRVLEAVLRGDDHDRGVEAEALHAVEQLEPDGPGIRMSRNASAWPPDASASSAASPSSASATSQPSSASVSRRT
jgi:hypothetical protein